MKLASTQFALKKIPLNTNTTYQNVIDTNTLQNVEKQITYVF